MWKQIKSAFAWAKAKILWILAIGSIGVVLAYGGTQLINPPIPEEHLLKAPKEMMLGSKEVGDDMIKYAYKTHKINDKKPSNEVKKAEEKKVRTRDGELKSFRILDENISKRTAHAKTYPTTEKGIFVTEIISGVPQYYQDPQGDWWQADYATTTKGAFERQTKTTFLERILGETAMAQTTFYPDPDTENTTVDGDARQTTDASWVTMRGGAGEFAYDNFTSGPFIRIVSSTVSDDWSDIYRGIFLFDVSAISGDTIISGTFSLYAIAITDQLADSASLVSSAPADNNALVAGDYDSFGTTKYAPDLALSGMSTSAYNVFTLNGDGETFVQNAIDVTEGVDAGIVKFGTRSTWDNDSADGPTWESEKYSFVNVYFADEAGTDNDPKLVVTHEAGAEPVAAYEMEVDIIGD